MGTTVKVITGRRVPVIGAQVQVNWEDGGVSSGNTDKKGEFDTGSEEHKVRITSLIVDENPVEAYNDWYIDSPQEVLIVTLSEI